MVIVIIEMFCMWALSSPEIPYLSVYIFHHMDIGHISLFSLGLAIPNLLSTRSGTRVDWLLLPASFLVFWVMVHFTRLQYFELSYYLALFFILSTFGFCYLMIAIKPRLILGRILILLGTYSYAIYLFHISLYDALESLGALEYGLWTSVVYVLVAFPIFVLACILAEKLNDRLGTRLERYVK